MTPFTMGMLMLGALALIGLVLVLIYDRPKGSRRQEDHAHPRTPSSR